MSHGTTFYGDMSYMKRRSPLFIVHMHVCNFEFAAVLVVVTMTAYRCPVELHFTRHLMVK